MQAKGLEKKIMLIYKGGTMLRKIIRTFDWIHMIQMAGIYGSSAIIVGVLIWLIFR